MRGLALLALLTLAACGGREEEAAAPAAAPRANVQLAGVPLASLQANPALCLFTLGRSGARIEAVAGPPPRGQCGVADAVAVYETSSRFNRSFVATCSFAAAFLIFEETVLQPQAERLFGQPVAEVEHWGTYACRTRNSARGGKLSEHAYGNAIDIAGFRLADGRRISVARDWRSGGRERDFLKALRRGACGIFEGVLGPGSDRNHRDHFHFDMGPWRFCR